MLADVCEGFLGKPVKVPLLFLRKKPVDIIDVRKGWDGVLFGEVPGQPAKGRRQAEVIEDGWAQVS